MSASVNLCARRKYMRLDLRQTQIWRQAKVSNKAKGIT